MRGTLMLVVLALGAFWAFDAYEYGGRYTQAAWQQAIIEGRNLAQEVKRWVDMKLSGQ
jgi:hypothetical protein